MRLFLSSCVLFAIIATTVGARLKRSLTDIEDDLKLGGVEKEAGGLESAVASERGRDRGRDVQNGKKSGVSKAADDIGGSGFTKWSQKELGSVPSQMVRKWDENSEKGKVIQETGARSKVIGENAARKVENQNIKDVDGALGHAAEEQGKSGQYYEGHSRLSGGAAGGHGSGHESGGGHGSGGHGPGGQGSGGHGSGNESGGGHDSRAHKGDGFDDQGLDGKGSGGGHGGDGGSVPAHVPDDEKPATRSLTK